MYEEPSLPAERIPVHVYKFYKEKRRKETLAEDAPLYLAINHINSKQLAFQTQNGSNHNQWQLTNSIL